MVERLFDVHGFVWEEITDKKADTGKAVSLKDYREGRRVSYVATGRAEPPVK